MAKCDEPGCNTLHFGCRGVDPVKPANENELADLCHTLFGADLVEAVLVFGFREQIAGF